MIRELKAEDIPWLKENECGYEWEFGKDFAGALVFVDENDKPLMCMGSWRRAECHGIMSDWGTPGAREAAFRELHNAMECKLRGEGVGEVVTWEAGEFRSLGRRLAKLGWSRIVRQAWGRPI